MIYNLYNRVCLICTEMVWQGLAMRSSEKLYIEESVVEEALFCTSHAREEARRDREL